MADFTVAHVITHEVSAETEERAREKSDHFVRQKIEDDACNDPLAWKGSEEMKREDN